MLKNEQKFYSALEDVFIGEAGQKIEGRSGFVNLMKIKSQYFANIKPFLQKEINEKISDKEEREELYQKLYTFFESYLNETGTPFFSKTPFHKNLYERVYSEKEDVTLFWKTQKLYYVKSEATYHSISNMEIDDLIFDFDASNIEHQKSNEKKELEFYLTDATEDKLNFKVAYVDNSRSKYDRLKNYLDQSTPDKVRKYIADNFEELNHSNIIKQENSLNREGLKASTLKEALFLVNNEDSVNSVTIEFAISKLDDMLEYAKVNNLYKVTEEVLKKAFSKYKKQNEVDYFIHKDAEGFLKEQFDLFIYDYLFNEKSLYNEWTTERIEHIQKLKEIAYSVIKYIAKFEDELKAIWNKPKFVRNTNYVFTLDKIADKPELIKKLIEHEGWGKQVEEWKELNKEWTNDNGEVTKKEWKEFELAANVKKKSILNKNKLNDKYKFLPIDTKHFGELKFEILDSFDDLEKHLDGTLIKSDNYQALNTILPKYKESVDLIYIDPPFNTGDDFDYKDKFQDSTWLTLMSNRLDISKEILSNEGNFYLHLDYNANFLGRILLDNKFPNNFQSEIVFKRTPGHHLATGLDVMTDTVFYYSKTQSSIYNQQYSDLTEEELEEKFPLTEAETGRRFNHQKLEQSSNAYSRNETRNFGDKVVSTNLGWRWTQKTIDERLEENPYVIYWTESGKPRYKIYADEYEGRKLGNLWDDITLISSNSSEAMFFATQKPEHLLYRIIHQSTKKDSIILDYFSGAGTTVATAHKLNKKWLGVELGSHYYQKIIPRLKKILIGDKGGISKMPDVNWQGGGFFKYYELEQYEDALARAKYNPKEDDISNINFTKDEKLLDALVIDNEKEEVKMHFELLYPDVDIAETISNVTGKKIKKLNKERVEFEDGTEIKFDEMNYNDPHFKDAYKKLLWWKSKE